MCHAPRVFGTGLSVRKSDFLDRKTGVGAQNACRTALAAFVSSVLFGLIRLLPAESWWIDSRHDGHPKGHDLPGVVGLKGHGHVVKMVLGRLVARLKGFAIVGLQHLDLDPP